MAPHIKLRPKKTYGKSLKVNQAAIDDMLTRRSHGETYKAIADVYGITTAHAWTVINKN